MCRAHYNIVVCERSKGDECVEVRGRGGGGDNLYGNFFQYMCVMCAESLREKFDPDLSVWKQI